MYKSRAGHFVHFSWHGLDMEFTWCAFQTKDVASRKILSTFVIKTIGNNRYVLKKPSGNKMRLKNVKLTKLLLDINVY